MVLPSFIDKISKYGQPSAASQPAPTVLPPGSSAQKAPAMMPPAAPSQAISGPVNAKQNARVGDQNISITYLPDLGSGLLIAGIVALTIFVLWMLL